MENSKMSVNSDYIDELRKEYSSLKFNRIERTDGLYVTWSGNLDTSNDLKLFTETQVKRALAGSLSPLVSRDVKKKLSYFSQQEDKNDFDIYQRDSVHDLIAEEIYAIQNIGHATQLIQIPGFNVLTDPTFNRLNWLLYPSMTKSHISIEKLPNIDVILISHNHRDHVDTSALKELLKIYSQNSWPQPKVLVPLGDKKLFENVGYNEVEEVDWYTKIQVTKDIDGSKKLATFTSIPANHRSGRNFYDHHKSLVCGWLINPVADNVIFKYSGDTRSLPEENQAAVDAVIWYEIKTKNIVTASSSAHTDIPNIICFEPSGPNYTRYYMDVTHQSTSYSALLKFLEAENLAKFSRRNPQEFLQKMKTVMMHHNKYELGPDRFNEGLFVFKKLLQYLKMNQDDLDIELAGQKNKLDQSLDYQKLKKKVPFTSRLLIASLPPQTSLLVHAKDFIIREIKEVTNIEMDKERIKEVLLNNTTFPKIGERINNEQIENIKFNVDSIHKYERKCEFCK